MRVGQFVNQCEMSINTICGILTFLLKIITYDLSPTLMIWPFGTCSKCPVLFMAFQIVKDYIFACLLGSTTDTVNITCDQAFRGKGIDKIYLAVITIIRLLLL